MVVSGTGISDFTLRVADFRIQTQLALSWFKAADGCYRATDRGAASDVYECEVTSYGLPGRVHQIISGLYNARVADDNLYTLSQFASDEKIFGADVDYSGSIDAVLMTQPRFEQKKLHLYSTKFKLRAIGPVFTGTASFPSIDYCEYGVDANVDGWAINRLDSYNNTFVYQEHNSETGLIKFKANLSQTSMANIRRVAATTRGGYFTLMGVDGLYAGQPWGPIGYRNVLPQAIKMMAIDDEELFGLNRWKCTITIAQESFNIHL
jgi:hypothetical protein